MKKSKSYEERIQNQFGGFWTRVLKNEAKYIYRELSNQAVKEKVFDELSDKELSELAVYDNYFNSEHVFNVHGKEVVVNGDLLAEALEKLPADKRDVILLSYFLEMTDAEIGKELDTVRQNISKRRAYILKLMRKYLEKEGFEWPQTWKICLYRLFLPAKSGDGQALGAVLNHYQRYIRSLATRTLTDECGNKVYYVDEEIRLRLEARLIYCIVADFKILPV